MTQPDIDVSASSSPTGPRSAKQRLERVLPARFVDRVDRLVFAGRRARIRLARAVFARLGYNVVKRDDYYSTLPVLEDIERTQSRWDRPSALVGIEVDVPAMTARLLDLASRWENDFRATAGDHAVNQRRGLGPGYPAFDARTLYYVLREHRPSRYVEVGSGLSTLYARLAASRNEDDGAAMKMTCIEPYPFDALRSLPGVDLVVSEVQDADLGLFTSLTADDVLFIDSSHALKIDSDVAFLFLEVLPRLAPGVLVHIHDVPFPYNVPYPSGTWLFGERWPVYWNEAMVVQAFLTGNEQFEILLSTPLIRHDDEAALCGAFADYVPVRDDPNPPSSLWLRRTAT